MNNNTHVPALLLAALLVVAFAAAPRAPAAPPAPKAVCPETDYDFGEMENTGTVEHDYVVRNEGTLPLELLNVRTSCGCTAATPTQTRLAPAEEGRIHVAFDLKNRSGRQEKLIIVTCNDPERPTFTLCLTGTAVQSVRAIPSSIFFGRVGPDAERTRTFRVVAEKGDFEVQSAVSDAPWLLLEEVDASGEDPDPSAKTYRVTLAETAPEGDITATVTLRLLASRVPKTLLLPVRAYLPPPPTSSPSH